jgi:hypothetical protein
MMLIINKYQQEFIHFPDPQGIVQTAVVNKWKRDENFDLTGYFNLNQIFDTSIYKVESLEVQISTRAAKIIAENIYGQVDEDGNAYTLLDSSVDHNKEDNL